MTHRNGVERRDRTAILRSSGACVDRHCYLDEIYVVSPTCQVRIKRLYLVVAEVRVELTRRGL